MQWHGFCFVMVFAGGVAAELLNFPDLLQK